MQVTAAPTAAVSNGLYNFKLRVSADNAPGREIPLAVSVTQAGSGAVQFRVADIYTSTLDAAGQPIPGLANATIKVQNEAVLTVQQTVQSNAGGVASLASLPTGTYLYRASAPNHMDASGKVAICDLIAVADCDFKFLKTRQE